MSTFDEYLSQPCDEPDCGRTAIYNQAGRRVCNQHLDDRPSAPPAFSRDD